VGGVVDQIFFGGGGVKALLRIAFSNQKEHPQYLICMYIYFVDLNIFKKITKLLKEKMWNRCYRN
jgi:hypothetical protein